MMQASCNYGMTRPCAEHLGVSMEQIIAAFKRIRRRARKVHGDAGMEVP